MEKDHSSWDRVYRNFNLLTFDDNLDTEWGLISNGAVAIQGERIAWVGASHDLPTTSSIEQIDGEGKFLTPGLIDCHTHLAYGGSRADEWQKRLQGVSYEQIAREGGGILSTVKATRNASEEELLASATRRAKSLLHQGVTTLEVKSGYGLNLETELKLLRVANQLGREVPVSIHTTLLGAHALPSEYKNDSDGYIDLVCREMIPAAKDLASAVDVFTEKIAFNLEQTERVFHAALECGFKIKVHAEQLSNMNGAKLAASMGAISADHLEYLDEPGVAAMAEHGTVAVLLPGAFYFLNETQKPPVELLRQYNVPLALATDANPGSSPVSNILLMANMGCVLFGMRPDEAIRGLTINAAKALRVETEVGSLTVGKQADFACWNINSPAELAFAIGQTPCNWVVRQGKLVEL